MVCIVTEFQLVHEFLDLEGHRRLVICSFIKVLIKQTLVIRCLDLSSLRLWERPALTKGCCYQVREPK